MPATPPTVTGLPGHARSWLGRIPSYVWYALMLVLLSRLTLIPIGLVLTPLASYGTAYQLSGCLPRFAASAFPLYILLAKITRDPMVDSVLTISSALLQGLLMSFYACGSMLVF